MVRPYDIAQGDSPKQFRQADTRFQYTDRVYWRRLAASFLAYNVHPYHVTMHPASVYAINPG